jgi:methyltransferase
VTLAVAILAFVTVQRLIELVIARSNTRYLLARGGIEIGRGHYPLLVVLHAAWLAALWWYGRQAPVNLVLLALFMVMQALRVWVLATLGRRWTTRIIVLPGAPLVARGPFRFLRHPNYCVVVAEIALLPLALGLPWLAVLFSILNALVLTIRIRAENGALAGQR